MDSYPCPTAAPELAHLTEEELRAGHVQTHPGGMIPTNRKRQREAEVPSSSLSGQVKIEDGSEAGTAAPLGEGHHSNQKMELDHTPGGGNALVEKDEPLGLGRETKAKKEHLETVHGAGTAEREGTAPGADVQVRSTGG